MSYRYPAAIILSLLASSSLLMAAGGGTSASIPDFTKGAPIPEGFTHDWNLGPTGARGWIYSDKLVTSDARQILSAIPQLTEAATMFDKGEKNFPQHMSVSKAAHVRKAIAEIEAATDQPELQRIR